MLSEPQRRVLFDRYKELYGKYPGYTLDATEEEQIEYIKELIQEKEAEQ